MAISASPSEAARRARAAAPVTDTFDHPTEAARPASGRRIEAELAALTMLSNHDLRIAWRRLYRCEPPPRLSRDLLLRAVAYKMQERVSGGLTAATRRQLLSLARAVEAGAVAVVTLPKPGARLVRGWRGKTHVVTVLDDGFEYAGKRHRSLSEIATCITGTHWSGPRFFGLTSSKSAKKTAQ